MASSKTIGHCGRPAAVAACVTRSDATPMALSGLEARTLTRTHHALGSAVRMPAWSASVSLSLFAASSMPVGTMATGGASVWTRTRHSAVRSHCLSLIECPRTHQVSARGRSRLNRRHGARQDPGPSVGRSRTAKFLRPWGRSHDGGLDPFEW